MTIIQDVSIIADILIIIVCLILFPTLLHLRRLAKDHILFIPKRGRCYTCECSSDARWLFMTVLNGGIVFFCYPCIRQKFKDSDENERLRGIGGNNGPN